MASHIVGGEFSYSYLGEDSVGNSIYSVSVSIYEDCLHGALSAIEDDDPAYLTVFENNNDVYGGNSRSPGDPVLKPNNTYVSYDNAIDQFGCYNGGFYDSLFHTSAESVPTGFSNKCVSNIPATCLTKKTFTNVYHLPHNPDGYIITYQRCCRNAEINNIMDPGNTGSTFYATIPAWPVVNNSAVFKNYPPQIICLDNPLNYDHGATDADGDSLSYEFCASLNCCGWANPCTTGNDEIFASKPVPPPPDEPRPVYYDSVQYQGGYTPGNPMPGFPPMAIDPTTGIITGTPNQEGRYLVTVCCNEWQNGLIVNTIKREFQFVVAPCTKVVVADIPQYSTDPNTYIVDCSGFNVNFVNISTGGFSYSWNFGVPGLTGDTSDAFEPSFTYPDTGTYKVNLVVNPGSTCPDSIMRLVKIYPYFVANYADSGLACPGDTISFMDKSTSTLKPITYWKWNFGDGDSSIAENPTHSYKYPGTYNVTLISENVKDCMDTILKQLLIQSFKPFAGNDTIIVKGAAMQFDATGGTQYAWSPSDNLSNPSISDPVGDFPDTGTFDYVVEVASSFGCTGSDTIEVRVVNQAEFFVPDAFTPNGDGKNDVFKPIAVGYKSINYFCVFNRYGQRVYTGNSFDEGWDGTFNGERADMGVYFWEISFVDRYGKQGFLKGDVTLIR